MQYVVYVCSVRRKIDTLRKNASLRDEKESFEARKEKRDKNRKEKRRATNARAWW